MKEFTISEKARNLMTKETAEHYLKQAEQKLVYSTQASNRITERGHKLLSVLIAVLTGFSWMLSTQKDETLTLVSIIGISACVICCIILITSVISIYTIWSNGRTPNEMDIEEFMNYYHECKLDKKQYINCVADEMEAIEKKMVWNLKQIETRTFFYKLCLDIILMALTLCAMILIRHAIIA